MSSIQSRLTLYIVAGTTLLLIIAAVAMDHLIQRQLARDFDRGLLDKTMLLASLTDRDGRLLEFDFSYEFMPEFDADENERAEYFEIWLPDDTSFAKSRSLVDAILPREAFPAGEPRYTNVTLPDGRPGRMVSLSFLPQVDIDEDEAVEEKPALEPPDEEGETQALIPESLPPDTTVGIAVARGHESLAQLLGMVRTVLGAACLGLIATIALFVRFCVDRGLMPLRRIASEVRGLDSTKLNSRLSTVPNSEELKPITDQLNHLLERLDQAFEREKRFSGNVAHELRTPIAELRTLAEVGGRWPGDKSMVSGFFGDLVNLADDMERTVTNLLNLARLDAGRHDVELETINLSGVIKKCWNHVAAEADARGIGFDNRIDEELHVKTDADKLALIVVNLFSNAVNYSPPGSTILVRACETNSKVQFSVSNLTVDLTERDLPLMFERFWRKDNARSKGRYVGLGLSLVAALGEILELKVEPELDTGGTFTMNLYGLHGD